MLHSCLTGVKAFFTAYLSQNAIFATSFAYFRWIFMGQVLILGAKLAAYKVDGWDARHVHEVLDCSNALDVVIRKFEAILKRRIPHGDNEIFDRYVQKIRRIKALGKPGAASHSGNPLCESDNRFEPSNFGPEVQLFGVDIPTIEPDDDFWKAMFEDDIDWMMVVS
ncbi:hypothetical protein VTL71DRAFT_6664, partial [Oculimacula yallundae]